MMRNKTILERKRLKNSWAINALMNLINEHLKTIFWKYKIERIILKEVKSTK